jgi:alkylated DNA repair protein alkB family protein 8
MTDIQRNVYAIYDKIAPEFDRTRHSPWPGVLQFLKSVPAGSAILDIGCGNGKYLGIRRDCKRFGCDPCVPLVAIAKANAPHASIQVGNGLALPYADGSMDVAYMIAVLHHMPTVALRRQMLSEMRRVLKTGGVGLVTVWDYDAIRPGWTPQDGNGDYTVKWASVGSRYYHVFSETEIYSLVSEYFTVTDMWWEAENWYLTVTTVP